MSAPAEAPAVPVDRHGYARCSRCGSLRPLAQLLVLRFHAQGSEHARVECSDVGYCTRAAGVGRGELEPSLVR